jgi:hypothetical protein
MPLTWKLKQWLRTKRSLKNANDIRDLIEHRTGYKVSLERITSLLNGQPKTLDIELFEAICNAFQCELINFCDVTPSSAIPPKRPLNINDLIQPCAIAPEESLRSFINRVQVAALTKAESMTTNICQAARLLGTHRSNFRCIHQRSKNAVKNKPPSTAKTIPLPAAIFSIGENEDLKAFTDRIQVAAINKTLELEGNNTRTALRLGYGRQSLIQLRNRLRQHGSENASAVETINFTETLM